MDPFTQQDRYRLQQFYFPRQPMTGMVAVVQPDPAECFPIFDKEVLDSRFYPVSVIKFLRIFVIKL